MATALAQYLAENGLSQTKFSRKAGLSKPTVSQLCSGKRRAGLAFALAIERATSGAIPASYWTTVKAENNRRPPKPARRPTNRRRNG